MSSGNGGNFPRL